MLFHIVSRADWHAGLAQGEYRAASLLSEGFVHCSFAEQVAGVANALYRNAEGCCVVEIDPTRLFTRIAVEDSYGSGTAYPHVYGPIPVAAAVAVHELIRDADGDYLFSVCDAAGSASPDR
jgi:uncharacterized protein (DUF952 family)